MNGSTRATADRDRFRRLEYPNDDFPYYDGQPVLISAGQWLFVMATVVLGFLALIAPIPLFHRGVGQFIPAILFFAVPLAGLRIVAGLHWKAIFRRVSGRDVLWMVVFALVNMAVTLAIGAVFVTSGTGAANPALAGLADLTTVERVLFFLKTLLQLFGEEVLTVLPFLAILYVLSATLKLSRRGSIIGAWLLSALLFGLAHLPTYDWNLLQCIVVIGSARLILMLAYIRTKNIWVSTGAHVLNDWTFFAVTLLGASLAAR